MRFKFTGQYTNGHTSVVIYNTRFEGHEPTTVEDEGEIAKLKTHTEVEAVTGRPPKVKTEE